MKGSRITSSYLGLLCSGLITLLGTAAQSQALTLSAAPAAVTLHPGDQNVPITVSVGNSTYAGPISIVLTGLPSGVSASPLTLTAGSSGTVNLSASKSAGAEGFVNTSPSAPTKWTAPVTVDAVTSAVQATTAIALSISVTNPSFAPAASAINLPIVNINTNGVAVLSTATDIPGTITITSADGQTSYLPNANDVDNTATFHVHGHSTAVMPKKPYNVKLTTGIDLLAAMGLTCPYVNSKGKVVCDHSKSYILLANYDDKTFLRDWSASALANAIPIGNGYLNSPADSPTPSGTSTLMPWAPHSLFVELYLNGVYEGNYQLIEKVNVDHNRIDINELLETDTNDDITGGYQLEIDEEKNEDFYFVTPQGLDIGLNDPDYTPEVPEQTSYITNYVDTAEDALFAANFTDPTLGWRAYYDEASAVNFYIVNDLMGNTDGGSFYSSDYFYKSQDNPLLYMGPIWDFDVSSGNVNYNVSENPTVAWMRTHAKWYIRWFEDPHFKADVTSQWNALKNNGVFNTWLASIQQEAQSLEQSQANNFGRWPMQGIEVWPNPEAAGSYDGEVVYYMDWLRTRLAYLDSVLNNKLQTATALTIPGGTLRQGTPIKLQAATTGGDSPTGSVTFLSGAVVLGMGTLDAGKATLTTSLQSGTDSLTAVYNGDDRNGLSASTAASVTVLPPLIATVSNLTSSTTNASPTNPATFTVLVLGNSGTKKPTGVVAFAANGQAIGTSNLTSNGTTTFSPTRLPGGTDSIQATYAGDATYQGSSSNPVMISAAYKQSQTIAFSPLPAVTYGTTPIPLSATASSGLPVSYTVTGPAMVSGSTLSVTGVGSVTVTAAQVGNSTYGAATSVSQSFTVNRDLLTVTANNATRIYDTANPAFTYTVTGFVNGDTSSVVGGAAALATTAATTSLAGTYPITFSTESLTAANYTFTYVNGTLTITSASIAAAATPVFSPAGGTYTSAQKVVITDGTPGATIYYTTDGSTPMTSSARYTSGISLSGSTTLQAIAAAPGYGNSPVATASYTINLVPADFSLATSPGSLTVTAGMSGTTTISITPQNGFKSAVSFKCSGLPAGASCSFSPATITPSGGVINTTLTVSTSQASAALSPKSHSPFPGATLAAALCCIGWRKRRRLPSMSTLMMVMLGLGLLSGCGVDSPANPSQTVPKSTTSTVTITATSGALSHTTTLTLIVNAAS
jgi:hypothetical protein